MSLTPVTEARDWCLWPDPDLDGAQSAGAQLQGSQTAPEGISASPSAAQGSIRSDNANLTTPLLQEQKAMYSQVSSPVEVEFARLENGTDPRLPFGRASKTPEDPRPWSQTPSVYWLLPPFLLYCLAMGAVAVPKLNVILNLICEQNGFKQPSTDSDLLTSARPGMGDNNKECQTAEVHRLLANFMLFANLLSGTLCALSSPRLGALSDRHGRRFILAITALGMLFGDIITITAASFPETISVYWILLEFGLGGLAGSFIATLAVIQSYAADCTSPTDRSIFFGYLHGCMYAGSAIGPILGGLIIKAVGNVLVIFYVAFVCHLGFIFFIIVVVPESLSPERRLAARERYQAEQAKRSRGWKGIVANALIFFKPLAILRPSKEDAEPVVRTNLVLLAAVDTVVFGVTLGSASLVVMYAEYMFKWGNFESSAFVSTTNSSRVAMLLLVLPVVVKMLARGSKTNSRESRTDQPASDRFDILLIRVAVAFDVLGYIGYALSPTGTLFTISGVVASVGGIGSPTLQSALTTHVSSERTGELLGAVSLLHALSRISMPAALQLVYGLTVGKFASAVFWCLTATFGLACLATLGIRDRQRQHSYTRL